MSSLTHLDSEGNARMVDVGDKPVSQRRAVAAGRVRMRPETLELLRAGQVAKGDVLAVARVAGIQAAKRCDSLIPLCHSLGLDAVDVDFELDTDLPGVTIEASARVTGRTGVEMEALTAASVALLTIYDMAKALEKGMVIEQVRLLEKTGGKSGDWRAG